MHVEISKVDREIDLAWYRLHISMIIIGRNPRDTAPLF